MSYCSQFSPAKPSRLLIIGRTVVCTPISAQSQHLHRALTSDVGRIAGLTSDTLELTFNEKDAAENDKDENPNLYMLEGIVMGEPSIE